MKDEILTVYIGEDDVVDWSTMTGRDIIMPELLKSAERLIYNDLKETPCIKLFADIATAVITVEFTVKPVGIDSTLSKILKWAEESEEYEMCVRVKKLEEFVNKK